MGDWWQDLIGSGRLDLFLFFVAFLAAFGFIRFSVRMIRAQVSWWPGNVTPGGLHIHHVTFGLVFMLVGGIGGLAIPPGAVAWSAVLSAVFGVGTALVLDEFALVLHLEDVYWSERGRTSIDAVFVAIAIIGLVLMGANPLGVDSTDVIDIIGWPGFVATMAVHLCLVFVTLAKGKLWTGLIGIFLPVLLLIGAIRLSRPDAPWARRFYADDPGKLSRARRREERVRAPVVRAKVRVQELIAGRHDLPDPRGTAGKH